MGLFSCTEQRPGEVIAECARNTKWTTEEHCEGCVISSGMRIMIDMSVFAVFWFNMYLSRYLCLLSSISLSCNVISIQRIPVDIIFELDI